MTNTKASTTTTRLVVWRILNCIMAIFFGIAAFLQINDPDPVVWMCVYGICCIICVSIVTLPNLQAHNMWRFLVAMHFVGCLAMTVYVILYYGHVIRKNFNILHNEEGRELSGLVLVDIWLITVLFITFKSVDQFNILSCIILSSIVVIPITSSCIFYMTVDFSRLPEHCKGFLQDDLVT